MNRQMELMKIDGLLEIIVGFNVQCLMNKLINTQ